MTETDLAPFARLAQRLAAQLDRVVLGQPAAIREALMALFARGHVLLEGPPGTAKTLLVRALAASLGLQFRRIQFTPDLMPSDITGVNLLTGASEFTFRPGPLFSDLVLGDEINRAPAKTQAAMLEAMQERSVTVDGDSHLLSASFTVFATQNPIEFEGTYPLPEAELDRFLIKVLLSYPPVEAEQGLLERVLAGFESADPASFGVETITDAAGLAAIRAAVRRVRVEPTVLGYITQLVRATRDTPTITLGASPRATVALLNVAQASALMDGRDFVVPDDVKDMAPAVLRHRIQIAPELELEGVTPDATIRTLLERVEAPRG